MAAVAKAKVTFGDRLDNLTDASSFTMVFKGTGSSGTVDDNGINNALIAFLDHAYPGQAQPVSNYLSDQIDLTGGTCHIDLTDISTHLDGSVAGPPYLVTPFTMTNGTGGVGLPPNNACVLSYRADYGTQLEQAPPAQIPSDDDAIDQGAPPTHLGKPRPRAGLRGRIFLGPLSTKCSLAIGGGGGEQGEFSVPFSTDVKIAFDNLLKGFNLGAANETRPVVWTRRGAAVHTVSFYAFSAGFASQRRRQDVSGQRVHTWLAV